VGVEKTGLAKAARGRESDRHAISGRALERVELEPPINERLRCNGPLVVERIHRTSLYGFTGHLCWPGGDRVREPFAARPDMLAGHHDLAIIDRPL